MNLKVMTYNICSGMNYEQERTRDLMHSANIILENDPDILGLNEVHYNIGFSGFTKQAELLNDILKYEYMYYGKAGAIQDGYQGNALFSKYPILNASTTLVPQPETLDEDVYYEQRSFIQADIDISNNILKVLVTHFGLAVGERENALKLLIPIFKKNTKNLIFMGDLNIEPDDAQFLRINDILKNTADTDSKQIFTFPSDTPDRTIDYILTSHDIYCKKAYAPATRASDHLPYVAEIEF